MPQRPLLSLSSICALLLGTLMGCGNGPPLEPDGWADAVALPTLVDENPDANIIEVSLEARVGKHSFQGGAPIDVWTYNGTTPGPTLHAKVGDTLIVHFKNSLPEETTIHWHGLRVPNSMDGSEVTQKPVPAGGSFDYTFKLEDAGTFWYHPHIRSNVQIEKGLYGAIIVDDPKAPDLGSEATLMLDDVLLDKQGNVSDPTTESDLEAYFGREGNVLLVNGKARPTIRARPGVPIRFRLIDTANSRYFKLALEGHRFTRVGGDMGLLTRAVTSETVMVIPGERNEVLLTPEGLAGDKLDVRWLPYDRGYGTGLPDPQTLFTLALEGEAPGGELAPLPEALGSITPLDTSHATTQSLRLTESIAGTVLRMGINDHHYGDPDELMIEVKVGETQIWELENTTMADHPFHLHGFRFQVLDVDGKAPPFPEWKDTQNIPAQKKVRFGVTFDDRPGMWMFHCHILDHQRLGMMGMLMVMP